MGEDERRLFVGRLPLDIKEEEIRTVFNTYGPVAEVEIMQKVFDADPAGPQRCAFVSYQTAEAAQVAIQVLNKVYKFRLDSPEPVDVSVARARGAGKSHSKGKDDGWNGGGKGYGDSGYGGYEKGGYGGYDKGGYPPYDPKGWGKGYPPYDPKGWGKGYPPYDPKGWGKGYPPYDPYGKGDPKGWGKGYPPYDPYGKGSYGYDKGGYDKGGYDKGAYDKGGYDKGYGKGYDKGSPGGYPGPPPSDDKGYGKGYDKGSSGGESYGRTDDRGPRREEVVGGDKIYIGNLPGDIAKEAISMVFGTYGAVQDLHIMSGQSKSGQSCAFLTYSTPEAAKNAIAAMAGGYEIRPGEGNIIVKYPNAPKAGGRDDRSRPY